MAEYVSSNQPGNEDQPIPRLDMPGTLDEPAAVITSGHPSRTRWHTVGVVFIFGLLGNATILVLGILAPKLLPALHVSIADYGNITTAAFFIGIPAAIITGYCADRFGPRRTGVVTLLLSSIWNAVLPLFNGVLGFAANRFLFTLSNSPIPTGNRALATAIAPRHRSICAAIFNFTFPLAQLVLTAGGAAVVASYGWTTLVYALAAAGVVVAAFWAFLAPGRNEISAPSPEREDKLQRVFKRVVTSRTLLGTGIAWGCSSWGFLFLYAFLPLYFVEDRHLGYLAAGLSSSWPWIGGVAGGFAVGLMSDRLLSRTKNYRLSRTYVAAAGQVIFAAGLCVAALSKSLDLTIAMLFVAEFANEMSASIFQVIAIDTLAERSGSASAMIAVVTSLVAAWSSMTFGHLFSVGQFSTAFLLAALFPLIGALILITLVFPGDFRPWGVSRHSSQLTDSARQAL